MTWSGCEEVTWWLTIALGRDDTKARLSEALERNAPVPELIECMVTELEPRVAGLVRQELGELPAASIHAVMAGWRQAFEGGVPFEVTSVRPANLMNSARRRSVRVAVDVHEEGVHAEISHVASRHPTWASSVTSA